MNCDRKTIFGQPTCRFEARYDEVREPALEGLDDHAKNTVSFFGPMPERHKKTYVHDICVKCGAVVKRGQV